MIYSKSPKHTKNEQRVHSSGISKWWLKGRIDQIDAESTLWMLNFSLEEKT